MLRTKVITQRIWNLVYYFFLQNKINNCHKCGGQGWVWKGGNWCDLDLGKQVNCSCNHITITRGGI